MTIGKFENDNVTTRSLKNVLSGCSFGEDFVSDGMIVKIIAESVKGFYDKRFSENAIFVIMERCCIDNKGKIIGTGEAVRVYLSMFNRVAAPVIKVDGNIVRDKNKEIVRAMGTTVDAWKNAENAEKFMQDNKDRMFKIELIDTVTVRAWDNVLKKSSDTETREQKVYKCNWV